jgi:hypothetical protein
MWQIYSLQLEEKGREAELRGELAWLDRESQSIL